MGQPDVAARPRVDRLSREDARILKLAHGVIRGHTCKVLVLERVNRNALPSLDDLREHVAARLDANPRLRQRVLPTPLHLADPIWVDDPDFNIARHIRPAPLGAGASLTDVVAGLMAERLDRAHPLWCIDVVERLDADSMALVWRLHHAMADGATSMRLGASLLWSEQIEVVAVDAAAWMPRPVPRTRQLVLDALAQRVRWRHAAVAAPNGSADSAPPPPSPAARPRLSRQAIGRELRRTARRTPLAQRAGDARLVDFVRASLPDLAQAGKRISGSITVNDVVLAVIAGGVREWLGRGLGPLGGIRVKIPVSLHQPGEAPAIANRDSFFVVDLPVAEPDVRRRVLAINRETTERKLDHDAETLYRLGTHPLVARWAMSPRVFTFNVSNVRGPAGDMYVLGAHVREMYSLAEIAQHHTLRFAVLSASGRLCIGMTADADAVKDLGVLADGVRRAVDELLSA